MVATLMFIVIACMRVIQTICGKRASNDVKNPKVFFLYGAYYQAIAALFALITIFFNGFNDFTIESLVCGLITAFFLMIQFYTNLNAIKGCKLIVAQMFNNGGLLICCIFSWLWFKEEASIFQCVGLVLFLLAAYLLSSENENVSNNKTKISKKTWVLLVVMALAEGCVETSQKYFSLNVENGSVSWYSFFTFAISCFIMSVGCLIMQIKEKKHITISPSFELNEFPIEKAKFHLNKNLLICGILLAFALFVINLLVTLLGETVNSIVLFPVSASISICITALVGRIIYKEKLSKKNVIGVVLGLIAIIVLAILTPDLLQNIF